MSRAPRLPRTILLLGVLCAGALALVSCGPDLPATTLFTEGDHAARIYDLLLPMLWTGLGVFTVVEGVLLYTVWRYRQRAHSGIPAQIHGNTRIEILWTVAPALIVLVITVLTFRVQAQNAYQPPDAMNVTAVGHQWWYEFQYPEAGVVTANDLYLPVGRPVRVALQAKDVNHSFWVPRLAGKTDMIPGVTNYLTFKPGQVGTYYAECSVLCGESHAHMGFRVVVVPPEEFERWLAEHKQPPAAPVGDATRGSQVFNKKVCWSCHVINGREDAAKSGNNAPNLTYFGSRTTIAAGQLPNTPENLAKWLHNPGQIKPGNLMSGQVKPGYLSDQEIADLVAYLESMKVSVQAPPMVGEN